MSIKTVENPFLAFLGLGFLLSWPVLVQDWEVPLYLGALVWGLGFIVLFWFVIRPMLVPPGPSGG